MVRGGVVECVAPYTATKYDPAIALPVTYLESVHLFYTLDLRTQVVRHPIWKAFNTHHQLIRIRTLERLFAMSRSDVKQTSHLLTGIFAPLPTVHTLVFLHPF